MAKPDLTFKNISQRTIAILEDRGMSQTQIAEFMEVSKSYISRVKAGTRAFTLEHLSRVDDKFEKPLSVLLFRTVSRDTMTPKNRGLYDLVQKMVDPKPVKRKKRAKAA